MTVSMLRGPEGRQRKEFERLVDWLALPQHKPDIVFLSNILLAGLAAAIKAKLAVPILCFLQDEDGFLDGLAHPYSERAWELLSPRTEDIDLFISVSKYYAGVMSQRLNLDADKLHVVYPGISLDGFAAAEAPPQVPTIGYLSRMCPSRGLDTLVDAFIELKEDARLKNVRLRISGGKNPGDEVFVEQLCQRLTENGCIDNVEFLPDFDRTDRQAFLQTLSVLSVPEKSPVAFGLYVLEALAAAVPVVQPAHGAFPELVEKTGGGLLYEPNNSKALAEMLRKLLLEPALAHAMGEKAGKAMLGSFSVEQTAAQIMSMCQQTTERFQ
jgi:glycosyltransferase involved in cell wall biosynthesis